MTDKRKTFISVDVSEDVKKEIKHVADENDCSISDVVRYALKLFLDGEEEKTKT